MIKSFFQSLEANRVGYLLISGQASVLYGAATFSEDIDLWIEPSAENVARFHSTLHELGAHYYKLTPPLEPGYLEAGHGFHFLLGAERDDPVFLDVMGRPPRSREFAAALRASRAFSTDWGTLPTIAIRDLIELKKTQRLADYPIISALTMRLLEEEIPTSPETLAWAATNLFTIEAFFSFNEKYPAWVQAAPAHVPRSLTQVSGQGANEIPAEIVAAAQQWMAEAMGRLQLADRAYWRSIIAQLRDLRNAGQLAPEGSAA